MAQAAAKAGDFSCAASLCTGETDSPLEEAGFEPSVPPQEGTGSPAALIETAAQRSSATPCENRQHRCRETSPVQRRPLPGQGEPEDRQPGPPLARPLRRGPAPLRVASSVARPGRTSPDSWPILVLTAYPDTATATVRCAPPCHIMKRLLGPQPPVRSMEESRAIHPGS